MVATRSADFRIGAGVPQRPVLSATLFLIQDVLALGDIHRNADDSTIHEEYTCDLKGKEAPEGCARESIVKKTYSVLEKVSAWGKKNLVDINIGITQACVFSAKTNPFSFQANFQFATVYKARDVKTDKIVAVKKIKIGNRMEARDGINRTALREIKLLQELQHINLIGLLDVFGQKSNVSLVFDFMDTDLEMIIKDINIVLTPANVKAYMIQTLKGLEYLHINWILHRDLKPNNLLVSSDGILKIGDFGLAKAYGSLTRVNTHQVVTRWYRSPELLFGARQYGVGVDMWALGCILAELLLRVPFLPGESDLDQLMRIFQVMGTPTEETWPGMKGLPDYVQFKYFPPQQLKHIFSAAPDDLLALLSRLLALYPDRRGDCTAALNMPYFSNKPAPTVGSKLPLPSNFKTLEVEKPSLKRKILETIDGGTLAKRLQF